MTTRIGDSSSKDQIRLSFALRYGGKSPKRAASPVFAPLIDGTLLGTLVGSAAGSAVRLRLRAAGRYNVLRSQRSAGAASTRRCGIGQRRGKSRQTRIRVYPFTARFPVVVLRDPDANRYELPNLPNESSLQALTRNLTGGPPLSRHAKRVRKSGFVCRNLRGAPARPANRSAAQNLRVQSDGFLEAGGKRCGS